MRIVKLTSDYTFGPFDCGNADLNDFLLYDAKLYLEKKLSVTYILEDEKAIVGYFSLSNDKLTVNDAQKSVWRKIKRSFDHSKHRSDYPAVKIGRLAVDRLYQDQDIGTDILNFVKTMFLESNRSGCVFVTVDALNGVVGFYSKNKFKVLDSLHKKSRGLTVPMYYNLLELL